LPLEKNAQESVEILKVKASEWAEKGRDFSPKVVLSGPIS